MRAMDLTRRHRDAENCLGNADRHGAGLSRQQPVMDSVTFPGADGFPRFEVAEVMKMSDSRANAGEDAGMATRRLAPPRGAGGET
jgi:hypothetical protein